MKTLLVIAKQAGLAEAIRAVLDPEQHRVVHQKEMWEAEPLLNQGTIDACVLDADLTNIQPIRLIENRRGIFSAQAGGEEEEREERRSGAWERWSVGASAREERAGR